MQLEAAFLSLLALLSLARGGHAQCDYTQSVPVGVYYDIASPNYPNKYPAGSSCRWYATSPSGSRLKLSCNIFNIPQSTNCQTDRVSVSPSGAYNLSDAHVYCGNGAFSLLSDANMLNMVLSSVYYSSGGYFLCNITAVANTPSCSCGIKKQTRIVGGTETGVNEYPMMAALVDSVRRELYCGATIVSAHYGLTAAHCLSGRTVANVGLLVGEHDITTGSETSASKLYRLTTFIPHERYDPKTQFNDLALVRTDGAITMSREVMPACLPYRYSTYDFSNQKVQVLGWGSLEYGGATSNKLMKADLYVQTPAQCTAVYGNEVDYSEMCTYNSGKDACQNDSGGPVLWQDPESGRVHVVGVVSHGVACATTNPGVNTRVTFFLDWITNKTSEDQVCYV